MTAYQKLKAENERLKSDLREVCLNPDSGKSAIIKLRHRIDFALTNAVMAGEPNLNRMQYKGIIPQIK